MNLIDTHTHIYSNQFNDDIDVVIENARSVGISKLLMPNVDLESIDSMLQLAEKFEQTCYPMIGLHPTSVDQNYQVVLSKLLDTFSLHPYIGIGEIGIDLYWDTTFIKEQVDAFHIQLDFALDNNLPVVIHIRNSFEEVFSCLDAYRDRPLQGVLHCFTGDIYYAKRAIDMGLLLGIGGVLTFKNSDLDKVIKEIDLQHLVLETDSPYLAPTPYRGKRNEPQYLINIAQKLAEIKNTTVEDIASITTHNATKLFFTTKSHTL